MKILKIEQRWDKHLAFKYFYLKDDVIIGTYTINGMDTGLNTFEGLWVHPEHRKTGLGTKMLETILATGLPLACLVHKDNWVFHLYEKHGFEYWYHENKEYYWMKNY